MDGRFLVSIALIALPHAVAAQPAPLPYSVDTHQRTVAPTVVVPSVTPQSLDVQTDKPESGPFVTVERIQRPNSDWIQLEFRRYNLGEKSTLTVRSAKDGAEQTFTGSELADWQGRTAVFNGSDLQVTLKAAPGETGIFYEQVRVLHGKAKPNQGGALVQPEAICDVVDDRIPSNDPKVGRIWPVGCTGWIITGGIHLTAGHCTGSDMVMLQFNVPKSTVSGDAVAPPPEHQYAIKQQKVVMNDGSVTPGNDWAIFSVSRNPKTKKLPIEVQGGHYTISQDQTAQQVRVTGYGLDQSPPERNLTQQTNAGKFLGKVSTNPHQIRHRADTEGGNSGGPIEQVSSAGANTGIAIGIHTNAGCDKGDSTGNSGTAFTHPKLFQAIKDFKD